MKIMFAAGLALGASLLIGNLPAHAQVTIRGPGVDFERGPQPYFERGQQPYWAQHREAEREADWRRRSEFREAEFRRSEWIREHCVRDWNGREFCRR